MKNTAQILILLLCLIAPHAHAGKGTMIQKSQLQEMFENIRAKTKWNIDGKMVWGYFFTGPSEKVLMEPSQDLLKMGYKVVNIYPADDNSKYWLHVEKIEAHSVESLHNRNSELNQFASKYKAVEYDGMDVGPVNNEK